MGFDPLSLISDGIGAVASIFNQQSANKNNQKLLEQQLAYNREAQQISQQYQTSEREASQKYQTSEREAQNQFSVDMYNKYQSPAALARQYIAAGLNPKLALDQSSVGNISASSGSSGGAPSGSSPSPLGLQMPYQNTPSLTQGFVDMAGVMKSLAEAKKAGVETKWYDKYIGSQIRALDADARGKEIQSDIDEVQLQHLPQKLQLEISKGINDFVKGRYSIEEAKEFIKKLKSERIISEKAAEHWDEIYEQQTRMNESTISNTDADTSLKGAQEKNVNANTSLTRAQTLLTKEMENTQYKQTDYYDSLSTLNNELSQINRLEREIREANSEEEKDALLQEFFERSAAAKKHAFEIEKDHRTSNSGIYGEISSGIRSARQSVLGR